MLPRRLELDGVDKRVYWQVVDHCYLCDLCYMTKCPYVPPHPWNVDFPHLMLRAKAVRTAKQRLTLARAGAELHRRGRAHRRHPGGRRDRQRRQPQSQRPRAARQDPGRASGGAAARVSRALGALAPGTAAPRPLRAVQATEETRGQVALFTTCYGNRNEPELVEDLAAVFEHNGIAVTLAPRERCCGMPKLELGDLESVAKLKQTNIPQLAPLVQAGYDIVAPIPSCVLMFKQELPLMFPQDAAGEARRRAHLRSVRVPDAAPQGGAAAHRFQGPARQASAITCRVTCGCRTSG